MLIPNIHDVWYLRALLFNDDQIPILFDIVPDRYAIVRGNFARRWGSVYITD